MNALREHINVMWRVETLVPMIEAAAEVMKQSLQAGGKLMFCGNGGSAADSQHMAAEFVGRFLKDREPIPAMALTVDSSVLTCIGNDYGLEEVFSRQVKALGKPGDCLIAISTSGNSPNVLEAVETARATGLRVIGLLGRDGGEVAKACDVALIVRSNSTPRIQEAHVFLGHVLCELIEESLP